MSMSIAVAAMMSPVSGRYCAGALLRGAPQRSLHDVASANSGGEKTGFLDYLMLLPSAVCGLLSVWQLDRMRTKDDLVKTRKASLSSEPLQIFSASSVPERNTLVSWSGHYDHPASIFVGPRVKSHMGVPEKGWIVVTPVYSADRDRAILVRRGWVPDTWRQEADRAGGSTEPPELAGIGVVSGGEKGSSVTFANDPEIDFWQLLDPAAMARFRGLPENTPLVEQVEVDAEAGAPRTAMQIAADKYRNRAPPAAQQAPKFPEPKKRDQFLEFPVMPYDHFNYALTWGALSVCTAVLAVRLLRKGAGPAARGKGHAVPPA